VSEPLFYESKLDPADPPASLRAVAWIFITFGILACISIVADLANGKVSIHVGVLGIFIGRGLLRYIPGWRTCGLVWLWFIMIAVPLIFLVSLTSSSGTVILFGRQLRGGGAIVVGVVVCAGFFALALWEYRVLTRPIVRRLFGLHDSST
jgi:hypothetical protein